MLVRLQLSKRMACSYDRPRVYLTFVVFAVLAAYQPAKGQESLQLPTFELSKPGVAEAIPNDVMPPNDAPSIDELSAPLIGRALVSSFKDSVPRTRGAQDISLFRNAAPSVVLIWTKDGSLGSGSLLKDNTILTNRHVVANERRVTVIFKPSDPSGEAKADEVVLADVIKLDVQRDLALLRPVSIPSRRTLDISAEDSIDVGTDVAAIGHPSGKTWTFTKGIVSAFRPAFEWSGGPNDSKHFATVIQTQTPISPGNSGGPLLTEDGKIVGVNSFATPGAESLNFAIAAKEIRAFLANPNNGIRAETACAKAQIIFEGRNDENTAFIRTISLRCDDKVDVKVVVPDNKRDPILAFVYSKRQNNFDGVVFDPKRSGKWTTSFWDINFDGTFPLKGLHSDGKFMPTSYVQRCGEGKKPIKDFKCA
jgi:S1-C subfamily serine protease